MFLRLNDTRETQGAAITMITLTEVVKKIGLPPKVGYENQFVCDSTIAQFHLYDVWIKLTVLSVCTYVWRMHKKSFFRDSLCKYRARVFVSAHEIGHSVQLGDRPVCARQHFRTKDNFKTSFDLNLRRSGSNAASSYAVLSATGIRAIFFSSCVVENLHETTERQNYVLYISIYPGKIFPSSRIVFVTCLKVV